MFIGHFGIALAAKRAAPKASLGGLFAAAQFIDLLWPTLLLAGIERARITTDPAAPLPLVFEHYPVSHSLLAVLGWSVLGGALAYVWWRERRTALVIGALVLSHWVLDAIVHLPDLPLAPWGSTLIGLSLWSSRAASMALELGIFAIGAALYFGATTAADRIGRWSAIALSVFLLAIHLANVFGPPPPDIVAVAWTGQLQWLIVLWAWWADRHRHGVAHPAVPPQRRAAS